MAVMAEELTRCPHCGVIGSGVIGSGVIGSGVIGSGVIGSGVIAGGTTAAIDALTAEVAKLRQIAEGREAELLREIRLLQETVARLRGAPRRDRYVTET